MKGKDKFYKDIENVVTSIVKKEGCQLLDITFNREKKGRVLRITVDSKDINLDKCSDVSKGISHWLDKHANEIPYENYSLEVSTPGLDSLLKSEQDFEKSKGKMVRIETKTKAADGRKRYKGRILSVTDGKLKFYTEEESTEFELDIINISKAKIEPEF